MMHSLTEENYLKSLYNLSGGYGEVAVNALSKALDVKMPTATGMIKRLAEKGLLHYESYKPVKLTSKGRREAAKIIRKHRLTEMFLVEHMNFGWEEVHDIAEQIEHIQSPDFFQKMADLLGHPKWDPHGAPIPDANGNVEQRKLKRLTDCLVGQEVMLVAVDHSSDEFLKFLNSRELSLGLRLKVDFIETFDHSMNISYGDKTEETFSRKVCERLLVEE